MAFRKWYSTLESRTPSLLSTHLPDLPSNSHVELSSYFLGSFGSAQRLDYGSGHELSFLAFLGCIWKLNGFPLSPQSPSPSPPPSPPSSSAPTTTSPADELSQQSRSIVLGIIQPYLTLIRTLIKTYTLEPAGSHGVWGLDDHSFLPYIFGSAQYGPPIPPNDPHHPPPPPPTQTPTEGSLPTAPAPSDIISPPKVLAHATTNLYFSAVHFIHEVKRGPFWEHSPMLYDISGVRGGWAKINKGMLKMYDAEVLGKFPVVQHFRFGSLFEWGRDEEEEKAAATKVSSVHAASHPPTRRREERVGGVVMEGGGGKKVAGERGLGTQAPWAADKGGRIGEVRAMGEGRAGEVRAMGEGTKVPWAAGSGVAASGRAVPPVRSAVHRSKPNQQPLSAEVEDRASPGVAMPPPTRAPWARPP